jgi:hypothetical protein
MGTGFLVAGILILTLEYNARRVLHQEVRNFLDSVSEDVFRALLEKIVPNAVFNEINDILRTEVVRKQCEYTISFKKPYPEMPVGYFVIRRVLIFTVESQLSHRTTFWVRSIYSGQEAPESAAWGGRRFHASLEVNGENVELEEGKNLFVKDGDFITLEHPVPLEPQGSADIILVGEEPCRIDAGRNSYTQGTPVIGLEVSILNEYSEEIGESRVEMNHPAREEMKYMPAVKRYVLDRAFLPGQGFQVVWQTARTRPVRRPEG